MPTFMEIVEQAEGLLRQSRRVSIHALKRAYSLDDETLEDLVEELVDVRQLAATWLASTGRLVDARASIDRPSCRSALSARRRQV